MSAYTLAPNAIFNTLQGEGHLRGFRMTFIRLAGCDVGCAQCDTDYSKDETATARYIAQRANAETPAELRDRWAWITGGEPGMHDLRPLIAELRVQRFSIAVATSGKHRIIPPVDWLSVSPHRSDFVQRYGHEIKIVEGLNGVGLWEMADSCEGSTDFFYRYVQPLTVDGKEDPASLAACLEFLDRRPNWSLSRQDHVAWGLR